MPYGKIAAFGPDLALLLNDLTRLPEAAALRTRTACRQARSTDRCQNPHRSTTGFVLPDPYPGSLHHRSYQSQPAPVPSHK